MGLSAALALAVSVATAPLAMAALRHLGAVDVPNERSSHRQPTLRGGGVAPVAGVLVGLATAPSLTGATAAGVAVAVAGFAALGLVEDLAGLGPATRFGAQVLGAAAPAFLLVQGAGPWRLPGIALALVWVVSYVNAYNFMDGINGISVAQAVVAGAGWWGLGTWQHVPALAAGGLVVAAAAAGFAPFNFPRARMFLGDTGSYGLGAALAALAVVGVRSGVAPEAVLAPLALYAADTGSTLVRRVWRGEAWYRPHRDHAYQRLVRLGWSHSRTTLTVAAGLAACTALGAVAAAGSPAARVGADAALGVVVGAYLALPALAQRRHPAGSSAARR